jgi:hypothetical protein
MSETVGRRGYRPCPKCNEPNHVRKQACDCGHVWVAKAAKRKTKVAKATAKRSKPIPQGPRTIPDPYAFSVSTDTTVYPEYMALFHATPCKAGPKRSRRVEKLLTGWLSETVNPVDWANTVQDVGP